MLKRLMGALPIPPAQQKFLAANTVVENGGTTDQRPFSKGESRLRKILGRRASGSGSEMGEKNCLELARDNFEISKRAFTNSLDKEYLGPEVSFNRGVRKSPRGSSKENLDLMDGDGIKDDMVFSFDPNPRGPVVWSDDRSEGQG
jgi:hypothetical protein